MHEGSSRWSEERPRDPNGMLDVGIKDLLNIEFDDVVPDSNVRFPWTGEIRRKAEERRANRPENQLMIDRMGWNYHQSYRQSSESFAMGCARVAERTAPYVAELSYPPEYHCDVAGYIKDHTEQNRGSGVATIYYLLLDMVHQGKDTVSFEDRSNPAEQYARNYTFSQADINRTRGYWALDHDLIEVSLRTPRSEACARAHFVVVVGRVPPITNFRPT